MTQPNVPGANLANYNSMSGMMREVLASFLQNVDDMIPGKIISYDRAANLAKVQPLIMLVKTDGTVQARAEIASIPVLQLGGGNFMMNFNLNPGDLGFIKANDRDISLFMQSFTQSPPNTYRKHNFSDSIFIPAPMQNMTINSEDESNMVISTLDGTQRIAIWPDRVKVTSNDKIVLDAPGVGIRGVPNANAILDVQSTTKAFMPPRMTQTQRDAIPSPQEGMMIYNLTTHGINVYNGTTW